MAKKKTSEEDVQQMAEKTKAYEADALQRRERAMALFAAPAGLVTLQKHGVERRSLPKMYKPADIPIGGVVHGEIIRFVKSPVSTVKGLLIWLRQGETEFTFPLTGAIRQALQDADGGVEGEIGKYLIAKRLDNGFSQTYKKEMFLFDVLTGKKEVLEKALAAS
jgi:hypothetical protein